MHTITINSSNKHTNIYHLFVELLIITSHLLSLTIFEQWIKMTMFHLLFVLGCSNNNNQYELYQFSRSRECITCTYTSKISGTYVSKLHISFSPTDWNVYTLTMYLQLLIAHNVKIHVPQVDSLISRFK